MKAHRHLLAALAAIALISAGAALRSGTSVVHAGPAAAAVPTDGTIADVAERVVDSVVSISTSYEADPMQAMWTGETAQRGGKGSGVIVTASGRILTNAHVVDGAEDIKVTLPDGTEADAKVIGKDASFDLAVIQLKGNFPGLRPLPIGDSSNLRLGEIVLAIGDGLGVGKSVSMGIVSAKGRTSMGIEEYEDFIQTDAAINPGNSGGALVNLRGELVGINTAIASRSGGSQGIGFAIPTNVARPVMEMLAKDGKVTRGYLGIGVGTATPAIAKAQKLGSSRGAVVGEVEPRGPAAAAGLKAGDVVVEYNGAGMKSGEELRMAIALTKPGTSVDMIVVRRDGAREVVKAKLGTRPDQLDASQMKPQQFPQVKPGTQYQQWQWDPSTGQWQQVQPSQGRRGH